MKLHKGLLFLLMAASFGARAAPEADLKRAVNQGNPVAVAEALKIGANVNARFDAGRTALMIAARRGAITVVEALLDAGADMYVLDNNHRDVLMTAVEYERTAVVRALIDRGFDPSLNDWRVLKLLPSGQPGDKASSNHAEIRKILEERKAAGTPSLASRPPSAGITAAATPPRVIAAGALNDDNSTVIIDVSKKKITPEMFKAAATKVLLKRGWEINSIEEGLVVGSLTQNEVIYKASVALVPPMVKVKAHGYSKRKLLLNIRDDLISELNLLKQ